MADSGRTARSGRSLPFLEPEPPIALAHRGFAPDGAENSMAAFERAVGLGYRYLETDVRVTADGVALAFHDSALDRVTDSRGRVRELSWPQVRTALIGGREPIALLADVLTSWPGVRVNIDVKSDAGVAATADVLRRTGAADRVCIGAFSDGRLRELRRVLGPAVCMSAGPAAVAQVRLLSRVGSRPWRVAADCLQVPARLGGRPFVDARLVRAAHGAGLPVHAWTVNDRPEMVRLLELGVDGIFTDRCDLLREVLLERGCWTDV
jgi:glycerophosphoryl diester phosphodiesterase